MDGLFKSLTITAASNVYLTDLYTRGHYVENGDIIFGTIAVWFSASVDLSAKTTFATVSFDHSSLQNFRTCGYGECVDSVENPTFTNNCSLRIANALVKNTTIGAVLSFVAIKA